MLETEADPTCFIDSTNSQFKFLTSFVLSQNS
jgi:hypothetical protein